MRSQQSLAKRDDSSQRSISAHPACRLTDMTPQDVLLHWTPLVIIHGLFPEFYDVKRHELGVGPTVRSIPISADVLTKREEDVRVTRIGERFEHLSPTLLTAKGCANVARLPPIDFCEETRVVLDCRWEYVNLSPVLQCPWGNEPHGALDRIWSEHPPM